MKTNFTPFILTAFFVTGVFLLTMPFWYNPPGHGGIEMMWVYATNYGSPVLIAVSVIGFIAAAIWKRRS